MTRQYILSKYDLAIVAIILVLYFSGAVEKADEAANEAFGLNDRPILKWVLIGGAIIALWLWF